jgi:hypothetical protein
MATRILECDDAISWLGARQKLAGCSFITSLPDFSEFPHLELGAWKDWFVTAARLVLSRTPDDGVAIFYQTDIRRSGTWIDKGYLCLKAAEAEEHALLWHKAVARVTPGVASFGRAGYSHLLCFSRGIRAEIPGSTADVLPHPGQVTWTRGMGTLACETACRFVLERTPTRTVVDPFCGHGTVLAVANSLGLNAIGVERSPKRARIARSLNLGPTGPGPSADL